MNFPRNFFWQRYWRARQRPPFSANRRHCQPVEVSAAGEALQRFRLSLRSVGASRARLWPAAGGARPGNLMNVVVRATANRTMPWANSVARLRPCRTAITSMSGWLATRQ
jgi:hypothetical protein